LGSGPSLPGSIKYSFSLKSNKASSINLALPITLFKVDYINILSFERYWCF
jgi:hypothetical protein